MELDSIQNMVGSTQHRTNSGTSLQIKIGISLTGYASRRGVRKMLCTVACHQTVCQAEVFRFHLREQGQRCAAVCASVFQAHVDIAVHPAASQWIMQAQSLQFEWNGFAFTGLQVNIQTDRHMFQAVRNLYVDLPRRDRNRLRGPQPRDTEVEIMNFKRTLFPVKAVVGINQSIIGRIGASICSGDGNPHRRRHSTRFTALQSNGGHGDKKLAVFPGDLTLACI